MTKSHQLTPIPYSAKYKPNQLICGYGETAVVTGWTVKQAIAKHLEPQEYAVIGQLYSPTRGINLLIRNLLLNPQVRYLVIVNATKEDKNAGACQCLLDFFHSGVVESISEVGRKSWVIRSGILGYIDIEIDFNSLERLRNSLEFQEAKSINAAISIIKSYAQLKGKSEPSVLWGTPLEFPMVSIEPTLVPGELYGHRISGKTIAETWVKIIHRIKTTGTIRATAYDSKWQELIDLMAIVTDEPADFYFPEPNYLPSDRTFLAEYVSQILDDAPVREGVKYTYGQRLRSWFGCDQIQAVINKLGSDINSARAVMSLWDVQSDRHDSPPCLNHIWIRVVEQELSLTATFRSNDMFSAWPANAMGLRALQKYILDSLNQKFSQVLQMGPLITISQSAHIYDDCWENAEKVIKSQYTKIAQSKDYFDPAGNFLITVQDGNIIVEHTTPGSGEVINCYVGKSVTQLSRKILLDCPGLEIEHAMYLGAELQKAEISLTQPGIIYQQDRSLKFN